MQLQELINANQQTLIDAETLLLDISDSAYTLVADPFTASLGTHMRHITDHYQQLLGGLSHRRVDYDSRDRNELVETVRLEMVALIRSLISQLGELAENSDCELSVVLSIDENARTPEVPSTLARELVFLQSHTTHHCAIISAMLKLQGVFVPESFGIAPSTLKYEHLQCAH